MKKLLSLLIIFSALTFGQSYTDLLLKMDADDCGTEYVNLFDRDAIYPDKNLSSGTLIDAENNDVTGFIPILPSTVYATNTKRPIAYYDGSKTYISTDAVNSGAAANFTTAAGAYFMRMSIGHFDNAPYYYLDMLQIVQQDSTDFPFRSPYGCSNSLWANQIWTTLGNSITDQFLWQPTTMDLTGLRCNEEGQGGTTLGGTTSDSAMYSDLRLDAIPSNSDLISIMGGTNDWGQSVPLGTLNSLDTTTFYGGINVLLNRILVKFPDAKIFFITPPFAVKTNFAAAGWADSLTNTEGNTLSDYVDAIKAVGVARRVPVCDIYALSGIDITNYDTELQDGIHPDTSGGVLIGTALATYLNANYVAINNQDIELTFTFDVTCTTTGNFTMKGTGAITVIWGDGNTDAYTLTSTDQNISHTYAGAGTYTIKMTSPSKITKFSSTANDAFSFDLNELSKTSLTYFSIAGTNSITGNTSSIIAGITSFDCRGLNTITGDISSLPTGMVLFRCEGDNSVEGDMNALPSTITFFRVGDYCKISGYTSGRTWADNMNWVYMKPQAGYGLSATEVDNMLIDLANVTTWVSVKQIDLRGNNAGRTAASDAAKAVLEGKGVTVYTN